MRSFSAVGEFRHTLFLTCAAVRAILPLMLGSQQAREVEEEDAGWMIERLSTTSISAEGRQAWLVICLVTTWMSLRGKGGGGFEVARRS